ncbi:hypothetical protein [Okeania sp. SIO2B3]|uniref:hypothetical protein n=1 Tax=Okeania sp. SIO2B3 TaxID=2607784 RepID=UPI0013BF1E7E|nr:hypothetical protein [Okeania sp. SIO2B3]NET45939.1 hypothetical protein [Okeania sp. SIO2B3]
MPVDKRDRLVVDLTSSLGSQKFLKHLLDKESERSGISVSHGVRILLVEALRARYKNLSLAQIIEIFGIELLAEETGMSISRLTELACEITPPELEEIVVLATCLPFDAKELFQMSKLKPFLKAQNSSVSAEGMNGIADLFNQLMSKQVPSYDAVVLTAGLLKIDTEKLLDFCNQVSEREEKQKNGC